MKYELSQPIVDHENFIKLVKKEAKSLGVLEEIEDSNIENRILVATGMLSNETLEEIRKLRASLKLDSVSLREFLLSPANPDVASLQGLPPGKDQANILHNWRTQLKKQISTGNYKNLWNIGVPIISLSIPAMASIVFAVQGHGIAAEVTGALMAVEVALFKQEMDNLKKEALAIAPLKGKSLPLFNYPVDLAVNPQFNCQTKRKIEETMAILQPMEMAFPSTLSPSI